MKRKPKGVCQYCELPVYAKKLCRRHYKKYNDIKNGTSQKRWQKIKGDPKALERKRMMDKLYREKKKNGEDTSRKKNDNSLINQDWRSYFKSWMESSKQYKRRGISTSLKYYENRIKVIEHYSKGKNCCARCGLSDIRVLDLDHINNNGYEHRKEIGTLNIIKWILENNFPTGFQILCKNCNWIKELDRREKKNKNNWK